MDLALDAAVQLIQLTVLLVLVVQNIGLRRRLRDIEARLAGGRATPP